MPPLLDPKQATAEAPTVFKVKLATTKGDVVVEVKRDWAPRAADRFFNLVKIGYYDDVAFFRVVKGFVVQFGMHGDPKVMAAWKDAFIMDEMVKEQNKRWTLTFAKRGSDTRTVQIFINLQDNPDLDGQGFAPFGTIVEGQKVVESLYDGYGEEPSGASGQKEILEKGNAVLKEKFPKLDYIKKAVVL